MPTTVIYHIPRVIEMPVAYHPDLISLLTVTLRDAFDVAILRKSDRMLMSKSNPLAPAMSDWFMSDDVQYALHLFLQFRRSARDHSFPIYDPCPPFRSIPTPHRTCTL